MQFVNGTAVVSKGALNVLTLLRLCEVFTCPHGFTSNSGMQEKKREFLPISSYTATLT